MTAPLSIGVLGGDGIGPEVMAEGMKVLSAASEVYGFRYEAIDLPYCADHALANPGSEIMPDSALDDMRDMDAVFLGAIGDPRFPTGVLERAIVGKTRFGLDLYINLRPIKLYAEALCPIKGVTPEQLDLVVVRENTEDAYTLIGGTLKKDTPDEVSQQVMIYTRKGVDRCLKYAFELAEKRKRKHLTLVDKANAIPAHDLWRRAFAQMSKDHPSVDTDVNFVDACCMWLVKNPEAYDVIVTTNLFGDIITDLGAMLQGGLGVAAGGNIHPGRVSCFEPIHGSAPKYKGQNKANPIATILAGAMLLDHVGQTEAAASIEGIVEGLITSGRIPSLRAGALPTDAIGDMVCEALRA
ncbi:MAG: 3-isopropylmalate dehydrogenase, partial [Planctomycetota bacterium]